MGRRLPCGLWFGVTVQARGSPWRRSWPHAARRLVMMNIVLMHMTAGCAPAVTCCEAAL